MMALHFCAKNMVVIVMVVATCASVTASISENESQLLRKPDNSSQRSHHRKIHPDHSSLGEKSSFAKNATNEKKMIHRLVGGHVKLYPKTIEPKNQEETTPTVAWDDGMMMSSAGNGKEKEKTTSGRRDDDDEEKKTLSQQVKEGKYGLIQNEIYPTPPKRPGVISYLGNPEVPKDTAKNYGGLEEEEIWLAENHLLVLRGGNFPDHGKKLEKNGREKWPPIDDYKAPERQVKIPPRPKVPPPFPVQLAEGGPVQIIGANGSSRVVNDTAEYDEYANYPEGFYPGEASFHPPTPSNSSQDVAFPSNFTGAGSYLPAASPGLGGAVGPFYPALPPGAVFLPPPDNNQSDYEDEDQSIYYPPPYSFYYPRDNATAVPPGPLVPGIILPPPPNFFAALEEKTTPRPTTTEVQTETEVTSTYAPRRKTVTKPYKLRFPTTTIVPTYATKAPTTVKTKSRTSRPFNSYVETTTSRPEKPTTIAQSDYYEVRTEIENHLIDLGAPQGGEWTGIVGTTAVPLLAYYATTPSTSERTRSTDEEVAPIHVKANIPAKNHASYYYYEETNGVTATPPTTPTPDVYFKTSTESPYYNVEPISNRKPKKQYYSVEMIPSQQTSDDYDVKLSSLQVQKTAGPDYDFSDPVQEVLANRGLRTRNPPRYYQIDDAPTIKPYYTTQRPRFYYQNTQEQRYHDYGDEQELKSNPVYQYSYEAADYTKQRYHPQDQPQVYDYRQQATGSNDQLLRDYDDYETRQPTVEKVPYLTHSTRSYSAGTKRPIIQNTTPDPHHAYYTKQDEQLLDDVTKQYFTIFGKKLPEAGVVQSTTPLYRVLASTTTENPLEHNVNTYVSNRYVSNDQARPESLQRFKPPKVKVRYGDQQTQRPYSLEGDTLVNYKNPLPPINPDAEEFVPVNVNKPINAVQRHGSYRTEQIPANNYPAPVPPSNPRQRYRGRYEPNPPVSLVNDIAVNYRDPRPPVNPDAEFITPVQGQGSQGNRGGSYFAYQLPGNGGHFYFLTPQAISQRQDLSRAYLYAKPNSQRIVRRRRGPVGT